MSTDIKLDSNTVEIQANHIRLTSLNKKQQIDVFLNDTEISIKNENQILFTIDQSRNQIIFNQTIQCPGLTVVNEKGRAFLNVNGAKGSLDIINQQGGGKILTISGIRQRAMQLVGNIKMLGTIESIEMNRLKRKVKDIQKQLKSK